MSKKNPIPKNNVPRQSEDIKKEYYQHLAQAGELQYQIEVYSGELKRLNGTMKQLNYEMNERQNLDAAAKAQAQADAAKAAAQQASEVAEVAQGE